MVSSSIVISFYFFYVEYSYQENNDRIIASYHALSILQCLLDQIYHMEHNTDSKYTKQSYVILILFQIQSLITSYLASGFSEMHIAFWICNSYI